MRQGGVYKLHSALQYIAGARLSEDARKDIMHLLLYIWCRNCHAASMLLEDPDGMMRVPTGGAKQSPTMLVALSQVSVSTLSCAVRPGHLEFRYRF